MDPGNPTLTSVNFYVSGLRRAMGARIITDESALAPYEELASRLPVRAPNRRLADRLKATSADLQAIREALHGTREPVDIAGWCALAEETARAIEPDRLRKLIPVRLRSLYPEAHSVLLDYANAMDGILAVRDRCPPWPQVDWLPTALAEVQNVLRAWRPGLSLQPPAGHIDTALRLGGPVGSFVASAQAVVLLVTITNLLPPGGDLDHRSLPVVSCCANFADLLAAAGSSGAAIDRQLEHARSVLSSLLEGSSGTQFNGLDSVEGSATDMDTD
jgi:hypothetical protein